MRGSDEERRDPGEILEAVSVPRGTKVEQGWPWDSESEGNGSLHEAWRLVSPWSRENNPRQKKV